MGDWLGVDIGGTRVKTALVDGNGQVLAADDFDTSDHPSPEAVCREIREAQSRLLKASGRTASCVEGVGVGLPGFLNPDTGVVAEAINLHWYDVPFVSMLEETLGLPVALENDANVAALGEAWVGAGAGHEVVLCVTVGTGVGGGIVIGGRLHRGANGMAGEIGHLVVQPEGGLPCNCGQYGCLETLASATAIIRAGRQAQEAGRLPAQPRVCEARQLFEWAASGVDAAREIVDEAAGWLGYGLSLTATVLNPDVIVVGGGVSKAGDAFLNPVRSAFSRTSLGLVQQAATIRSAHLSNQAGVIGAARLAQQQAVIRAQALCAANRGGGMQDGGAD